MAIKSYSDFINKSASEKVVIAHIHAVRRLSNFTSDSGLYSQVVDHVVTEVKNGEIQLTRVSDLASVIAGTFYYDFDTGKLYLYSFSSNVDEIIVTFRFFLSNIPINLPWDLQDTSKDVSYEPIILSIPKFKSTMTQGKKGVNLIGSGTVSCNNSASYFDDIYGKYIFDNKSSAIYSYHASLLPSQAQIIFRGRVTSTVFNSDKVDFNLTDDIYSLEQKVSGHQYLDEVKESDSLNFKRRIYGKVDNLRVQSISQADSGLPLTGILSGVRKSKTIRGVGTLFASELSEGDKIKVAGIELVVDKVVNNRTLTVNSEVDITFNGEAICFPDIAYYKSNRRFQVSDHALKEYTSSITKIITRNRLEVVSTSGFKAGDIINIGGTENKIIKRVSGNQIVLTSNYNLDHSISDIVTVSPVSKLMYGERGSSIALEDFTIDNSASGAFITLTDRAEINSASEKSLKYDFYFRNGHSKVWLGTPTIFKYNTLAHTSGSLHGKYFVVYNEKASTIAFWFGDDLPEGTSPIIEPLHGQSSSFKIPLGYRDYTASEIAEICCDTVTENLDFYSGFTSAGSFTLETQPQAITFGTSGTSGFTVTPLISGVTSTVDLDLSELIKSRDYLRNNEDGTEVEVLSADSKVITLRSNFTGLTGFYRLIYRNVDYIQDDTPVYVNCIGATKDNNPQGDLITTVPEVIESLLDDADLSQYKHSRSFTESSVKAPQLVSIALPYRFEGEMPTIKDVVNKLNTSVFGSLYITQDLELGYDILDASINLDSLRVIRDDDVFSWSASGDGFDLSKTVIGKYRFLDYDPTSKGPYNLQVNYTSDFVTKYVGNKNTREIELYLYHESEAQEQIERDELINSLSNSTIKIKGSLNLSKYNLGERVVLDFKRLYKASGGDTSLQVGVITSLNNNGEVVDIELENLGALYSRAATIADDTSVDDYSDSTSKDHLTVSFILDDNGLINNDDNTNNTSLIS